MIERLEFVGVCDTVAILVLPDAQFAPDRVCGGDRDIAIGVVSGQIGVATTEACAEHFSDVIDLAVAVAI